MKPPMTHTIVLALLAMLLVYFIEGGPATSAMARASESQVVPAVIRAQTIELVDERGTVRASLKTAPDGEVIFRMMDSSGAIRIKLGADHDGSGLLLLDEQTTPGAHLLAQRAGTTLTLADQHKDELVIKP